MSGANTSHLTIGNLVGADAGGYSVVLAGPAGTVTSAVATLTVIDPVITGQPTNTFRNAGESVLLGVAANGTTPLRYQWRKDGAPQPGQTSASLTIDKLRGADAGHYDVVLSSVWGSVTSAVALLTVNAALPDSFDPGLEGEIYSLALQADGKVLVGGSYGLDGTSDYFRRLNAGQIRRA